MAPSIERIRRTTAAFFGLALASATAFVACDDGTTADGGSGGSGSGAPTATSGGGASCQEACDFSFANCPGEFIGTKNDCLSGCMQGQPAGCTACLAHSCLAGCVDACLGGGPSSTSGGPTTDVGASSSSGGEPTCGTNPLDPSIGTNCFGNEQCATNACDNNTPNALNGYCTQKCSDISDCPCDAGGHVWTCELNPKLGAVQKYCIDQSKY
jgi:hypothetical protein